MIVVNNLSSILEIMFGVNAVFALIFSQYHKNKENLYKHIENESIKYDINFKNISKIYIQDAVYDVFKNFRILNEFYFKSMCLLSFLGVMTPLSLLYWSALDTSNAELSLWLFTTIIIIFIVLSPILYFLFSFASDKFLNRITEESIFENDIHQIIILAQMKSDLEASNRSMLELERLIYQAKLITFIAKCKMFFYTNLNPYYHYKQWQLNKIYKDLNL